ncbi:MAG: hypothetical protein GX041_10625 [Clostridiales bacterium]|nr:hypothetical protein [Clostridiales bacterium]
MIKCKTTINPAQYITMLYRCRVVISSIMILGMIIMTKGARVVVRTNKME